MAITNMLEEYEFEALPPALRRKYFSSLERLRLARNGSGPSQHIDQRPMSKQRRSPSPLSQTQTPTHNRMSAFATRSPSKRLQKSQQGRRRSVTEAEMKWYSSLPPKVQNTHFSKEEQDLLAGNRKTIILDPADEALFRLGLSCDPTSEDFESDSESFKEQSISQPQLKEDHNTADSAPETDRIESCLQEHEEEDETRIEPDLDEYHTAVARISRDEPPSGRYRPSFRRNMSVGAIQFQQCPPLKPTPSLSALPQLVDTDITPSRPVPTFLAPRHRPHASISSIDPAAKHYRDPAARLKLRVYLASPQKFDEALEFGFPSLKREESMRLAKPATSPRPTVDSERTFFYDDTASLFDDDTLQKKDDSSISDSEEPKTPEEPAFLFTKSSGAERLGSNRPCTARKISEPYVQACATDREMTLHMTLTRQDLRNPDEIRQERSPSNHPNGTLPAGADNNHSKRDPAPVPDSRITRFWRMLRRI